MWNLTNYGLMDGVCGKAKSFTLCMFTATLLFTSSLSTRSVFAADVSIGYSQNFDATTSLPAGWGEGPGDWVINSSTPSVTPIGPTADNTSGNGNFAYVEDSGNSTASEELLTPTFNLTGSTSPLASFSLYSYLAKGADVSVCSGIAADEFHVDVMDASGLTALANSVIQSGDSGTANWVQQSVDLSSYVSSGDIRLRFRTVTVGGPDGSFGCHDIALDDFVLFDAAALMDITGKVYQDTNFDGDLGAAELGLAGINVEAYGSDGSSCGAATSTADGSYTLTPTCIGPWRFEFTKPTDGSLDLYEPTVLGDTSVQFVSHSFVSPNAGFINPNDYAQDNPRIVVVANSTGDQSSVSSSVGVVSGLYDDASYASNDRIEADNTDVGASWGLGWQRDRKLLFNSAMIKRYSGLGPEGIGGVYVLDYTGATPTLADSFTLQGVTPASGPAIDLGSINRVNVATLTAGAAGDYDMTPSGDPVVDLDAFAKASVAAYGDIDVDESGNNLWMVNLNQRSMIKVDITGSVGSYDAPANIEHTLLSSLPGLPTCTQGELRPYGLAFKGGKGYLGIVCDASISQSRADLLAHVVSFDPSDLAAGLTPELVVPLPDLIREKAEGSGLSSGVSTSRYDATWNPWVFTWADTGQSTAVDRRSYPQPILSDIEFADDGGMILGFADRFGDQSGSGNYHPVSGNRTIYSTNNAGDVYKACNVSDTWVLESEAGCPVFDTGAGSTVNTDGFNGTGEFFWGDHYDAQYDHMEVVNGGLAVLSGGQEVVTSGYDAGAIFTMGAYFLDTTDGGMNKRWEILSPGTNNFAKGNALGDVEVLLDPAPIEIGNRVWADTNGNGIQDPAESGIAGVTVSLAASDGTQLASVVTDADGNYLFSNASSGSQSGPHAVYAVSGLYPDTTGYEISIDATQLALNSATPSTPDNDATTNGDLRDSDGIPQGAMVVATLATDGAGASRHLYDFGFVPVSIGNYIWKDDNVDGLQTAGEPPIAGVAVRLLDALGDAVMCNGAPVITTTDVNGFYLFDSFDCVVPDTTYQVAINKNQAALIGLVLTAQNAGDDALDSDAESLGDDHIIVTATSPATGADLSYDVGYISVEIGNFVWKDNNADGRQDVGEPGIAGVTVELLDDSGNPHVCHHEPYGVTDSYSDDFESQDFTGSTGSLSWSGDWQLVNAPSVFNFSGDYAARVESGEVISREFDMSVFPLGKATLTFDYRFGTAIGTGDTVLVEYNDGSSWIPLVTYDDVTDPIVMTAQAFELSSSSAATQLRVTSTATDENFYIDNVSITGLTASVVSDVTDASGYYSFTAADCVEAITDYQIRIAENQSALTGFVLTAPNVDGVTSNDPTGDDNDSDAIDTGDYHLIDPATSPAAGANYSYDFGYVPVEIGNFVWLDSNNDGLQTPGETGISGVTVTLHDAGGTPVECAAVEHGSAVNYLDDFNTPGYSNSNGSLNWTDVWVESDPAQNPANDPVTVTSSARMRIRGQGEFAQRAVDLSDFVADAVLTFDYGNWTANWSASDRFVAEYTTNGTDWTVVYENFGADISDTALETFSVPLPGTAGVATTEIRFRISVGADDYAYIDNVEISGSVAGPVSTVTDADGFYYFDAVDCVEASTNYQVRVAEAQPALVGLTLTTQDAGGVTSNDATGDDLDSDASDAGAYHVINPATAPAAGANYSYDFGYVAVEIGNFVWKDSNLDGLQSVGEPPIEGVTVTLHDDSGNPIMCGAPAYQIVGDYRDDFDFGVGSFANSDGSLAWTDVWVESSAIQDPDSDPVIVNGSGTNHLRIAGVGESARRAVDLSNFVTDAVLTFDYSNWSANWGSSDRFVVDYTTDGTNWTTVYENMGTDITYATPQTFSFPLPGTAGAADAEIRFQITSGSSLDYAYLYAVQVSGNVAGPVSTTTDANGEYYFTAVDCVVPNGNHQVRIDETQTALDGLVLTAQDAGGVTSNDPTGDDSDSDAEDLGTYHQIDVVAPAIGTNYSYDYGYHAPVVTGAIVVTKHIAADSDASGIANWEFTLSSDNCPLPAPYDTTPVLTTASGADGETVTFDNLWVADGNSVQCSYAVTETNIAAGWQTNADTPNPQDGLHVIEGGTTALSFVNEEIPPEIGNITVTKLIAAGNDASGIAGWEFTLISDTVGCDLPVPYDTTPTLMTAGGVSGQTVTFFDLLVENGSSATCEYTVAETSLAAGWQVAGSSVNPMTMVTVTADGTTALSITNEKVPVVDLQMTKTVNNTSPLRGETVIFTLTASNTSTTDATDVMASDVLQEGLSYLFDDGAGAYNPNTGVWDIGDLGAETSEVLNITVRVD